MTGPLPTKSRSVPDDSPLAGRLQKLLLFRLILAIFFLLLTLGVQSSREEDLLSASLRPLYVFSCILFLFTIVGAWNLGRLQNLARFAWGQLVFDTAAVTVLVYLSGGLESPFSFFYMLVIISSALLLDRRASILTASACAFVYGLLLDLQYFERISPLQIVAGMGYARDSGTYFFTLLINIAGFYLVAFLAGYLAEESQKSRRKVREHEKDLHQLSALHQSIVQSMTSGLLTVDSDGRIVFCNNAGLQILGRTGENLQGRPLGEVFGGLDLARLPAGSPAPDAGIGVTRMEIAYVNPSGEKLFLGYTASVLQSRSGDPFGWILIFQDLTQLKAIEERMQRMERLVFAGKIAAEIAHEIKNPLAAVSGAVQMLQEEIGQDQFQSRLMGIVQREIARINELVINFLWMAKGSPKPEQVEDVSVCSAIQEILALLKAKNQITASHSIHTAFDSHPVSSIDPHHLRQILWNLFINALESMPEGGDLSIAVRSDRDPGSGDNRARIDIADTGCGIPQGMREKIFDPFFTTKGGGTGLGLSIVCELVEKSGGRIEVSVPPAGTGTVFSLFFPSASPFSLAK